MSHSTLQQERVRAGSFPRSQNPVWERLPAKLLFRIPPSLGQVPNETVLQVRYSARRRGAFAGSLGQVPNETVLQVYKVRASGRGLGFARTGSKRNSFARERSQTGVWERG